MDIIEEMDRRCKEYDLDLIHKWFDESREEIKPDAPKEVLEKARRYDNYLFQKNGKHAYRNFVEPENLKEWDERCARIEELRESQKAGTVYLDGFPFPIVTP